MAQGTFAHEDKQGVALCVPRATNDIGQPFDPASDLPRKYLAEGGRPSR